MKYTVRQPLSRSSSNPPVLVILHGYGADEFDLLPMASKLNPSLLTISLQAPVELGWGGYAWYQLTQTPTGLREDFKSRKISEEIVIKELPEIISKEGGDPSQVYLMGFSQGAAMCYSLVTKDDFSKKGITIRAVIAMSGYIPDDVKTLLRERDLSLIPFFISHGTHDELISLIAMKHAKEILEHAGAKTFAKEYETGHGLTEETVSDIRNWLSTLLQN